jgi:SSS family transporter
MTPFYARTEFYTVVVYLLLMIAIGVSFARRNRGGLDFFACGRCVPWWVSGISLYMGNFSAWLFTGGAGMIYKTTWYGLIYFLLTGAVSYFLGSQLTAAQWRRSRVISPVEFTKQRFGVGTQQLLGAITAVVFIAAAGNQLKAIATVVNSILGVPIAEAAIAIGIIVILYTLIGGLWAVVVTDVLQFVVLLGVTLLIAPLAYLMVSGGLPEILGSMDLSVPPKDGLPSHDLHFLVAGLISFTLGVASGQGPRFYCVPDERSARKVGVLAAALFLTTPVLFSLPSLVARTVWGGPDLLGETIPGKDPHEQVFLRVAMEVLPPGLVGVFLAAMFAATMSALDTVYNMVASILSRDMYMRFRPNTTDERLIRVGRAMTLVCGVVTVFLCLFYIGGKSDLFTVMVNIFYISAPVMAVPVLMGIFYRRAPRSAGPACIAWGIATGLVTQVGLKWSYGPQIYLTQSISIGIFLVSPWLGSMWRSPGNRRSVLILGLVFGALVTGVMLLGSPENVPVTIAYGEQALDTGLTAHWLIAAYVAFLLGSLLYFVPKFAAPEDRTGVDEFYGRLDTPVDVATEVTGSNEAAISVFKLVGVLTFVIAGLVFVLGVLEQVLHPDRRAEWWKYAALIGILAVLGGLFLLAVRRTARATDA